MKSLYDGFKIYGPYTRKDGRKILFMSKYENGERIKKTVSYPKYLLEMHLGRYLDNNETADHINGDFTDDRIENLQVLSRSENSSKASIRVEKIIAKCVLCGIDFQLRYRQYGIEAKEKAGPFCSKKCSGKYGAAVQNGGNKIKRSNIEPSHYSLNNNYEKEYVEYNTRKRNK